MGTRLGATIRRKLRLRVEVVAVAVAALLLSACGGATGSSPSGNQTPSSNLATVALSHELEHIHGAAMDPVDGAILTGTHDGVWRIASDGAVTRVGQSQDDFMGLTVAGARLWLASGHPAPGSRAANPLGLIRSVDQGKTWTSVSLAGQVDFHSLAAIGSTVAGFDPSAGLMISADGGTTWKQSPQARPVSMAFTADKLLAATEAGLMVSVDHGASFAPIPSAPTVRLISASGMSVWCVDTDGSAWKSVDAGATWTKQLEVGEVSALAAVDGTGAYAVSPTELIKLS